MLIKFIFCSIKLLILKLFQTKANSAEQVFYIIFTDRFNSNWLILIIVMIKLSNIFGPSGAHVTTYLMCDLCLIK